jgi:hypothetical protein
MLTAIAIMALGAIVLGAALGYASIKFKVEGDPLVEKIEAILPQTQCGQCGYPGCKPYAEAIAKGEATSTCARRAAWKACASWPTCSAARSSRSKPKKSRSRSPSSTSRPASAARCASRPARSMPSSAPPSRCTPSSPSCAPAANCACRPARSNASRMEADRREHRQLEVEVSGDQGPPKQAPPPEGRLMLQLFKFKGGVKPQTNKTPSVQAPIGRTAAVAPVRAAAPEHRRHTAPLVVQIRRPRTQGPVDRRSRRLDLGRRACADLRHRASPSPSTSPPHPSGLTTLSVVIEPDGKDEWIERTAARLRALEPEACAKSCAMPASSASAARSSRPRQADRREIGADGRTGHQRRRVRTVHDLRRPADARTRRGSRARRRHLPRPAAAEARADRHRGQQAGSRRRDARRGRGGSARLSKSSPCRRCTRPAAPSS